MSAYLSPTLLLTASSQFLTIDPLLARPGESGSPTSCIAPPTPVCAVG
ncbi:hypothetical protein [Vulcanisaeta souniana]|nr:hypothetical protein [Vulcanisaeta souniana]